MLKLLWFIIIVAFSGVGKPKHSAQHKQFLAFCMVIGMGMRFPKTCFTEMHLPPGGRTAQSKMAAVRLYGSSTIDYKINGSWHEICQILCILGQGIDTYQFQLCQYIGFLAKSNLAAKICKKCIQMLTISNGVSGGSALYKILFER